MSISSRPFILLSTTALAALGTLTGACTIKNAETDDGTGGNAATTTASTAASGGNTGSGGAAGTGGDMGTGGSATTTTGAGGNSSGSGGGLSGGWNTSSHPCVGNRTDTLFYDADETTAWVGCGSTTTGTGLYTSSDKGQTWAAPTTTPVNFFSTFRVDHVSRSSDGLLYVAGTGPNSRMVVSLNTSTGEVAEVLNAGSQVGQSFSVGNFRRAADGSALAESLTGTGLLYRANDAVGVGAAEWTDASDFLDTGTSKQILDLELHDGKFYGCGSTISNPPSVFLPAQSGSQPWHMDEVVLATGIGAFDGEMWGVAVSSSGQVIAGGVNQDADVGMVYVSGSDPYVASGYTAFNVGTVYTADTSWIRGVCTNDSRIVAVGELSTKAEAIVFYSDDDGANWTEASPDGVGPVHECTVFADGSFAVAGADGFHGVYVP